MKDQFSLKLFYQCKNPGKVWVKKGTHIQTLAISKKIHNFCSILLTFSPSFIRIGKKCVILIMANSLTCAFVFLTHALEYIFVDQSRLIKNHILIKYFMKVQHFFNCFKTTPMKFLRSNSSLTLEEWIDGKKDLTFNNPALVKMNIEIEFDAFAFPHSSFLLCLLLKKIGVRVFQVFSKRRNVPQ